MLVIERMLTHGREADFLAPLGSRPRPPNVGGEADFSSIYARTLFGWACLLGLTPVQIPTNIRVPIQATHQRLRLTMEKLRPFPRLPDNRGDPVDGSGPRQSVMTSPVTLAMPPNPSRLLVASLDAEPAPRGLAALVVPLLGDLCVFHLLDAHGRFDSVGWAHVDPRQQMVLDQVAQYWHGPGAPDHPLARAWRTGAPVFVPDVTEAWLETTAADPVQRRLARALEIRSLISVPLIAQNQPLGALTTCCTRASGRRYATEDLVLAGEVARWAAEALRHGRLFQDRRDAQRKAEAERSVAFLSHDIRNSLTVIKMTAQFLRRQAQRADGSDIEPLLEGLAAIAASSSKVVTLVDALVRSASTSPGQPETPNRRLTDLVSLSREIAATYPRTSAAHQIRVEADTPLIGRWDRAGLARVLDNLVGNAVKYSPSGGEIVLRLFAETDERGSWAALAVRDQGLGIPSDDLPHVFELTRRAQNVREQIDGAGIGLTFVKEIVEQNGGTVSVTSVEGHGATFTVRLPLANSSVMTKSS